MLIALPIAAFCLAWLVLLSERAGESGNDVDWRGPFLKAAIAWGAAVAILSEGLGLFGLLRLPWLSMAWLAIVSVLVVLARRRGSISRARPLVGRLYSNWKSSEVAVLAGVLILGLALLAVAWVAPPNNVDSLFYHMPRVMHWVQNGSLDHYAASNHAQLFMPPWAEIAILHLRELWGSDKPANLVQWFSMVGSLIGVSAIAARLGAGRKGQLLAATFAATVPMGVLQATSTQNDYVTAFWAVCAAYWVSVSLQRPLRKSEILLLGLSFGLGILTKVTYFIYGAPLGVGFLLITRKRSGFWHAARWGLALAGLVTVLNLATWVRNLTTFGGLYGRSDWSVGMLAAPQLAESLRVIEAADPAGAKRGIGEVLVEGAQQVLIWPLNRVGQAAALNLITPSSVVNGIVWSILDAFPVLFDDVVSHSLRHAAWSHEDSAGNPLHVMLVIASGVTLLATGAGRRYLALVAAGFVLLPLVIQRGSSGFGIRYQLPFFIVSAPLFGLAVERARLNRWGVPIGILLLVSALPYLLFNNTRPIIGAPPWPTRTRSVFVAPAQEIMYAINPELQSAHDQLAQALVRSGCREVGLRIDSSHLEYQFWWMLDAPQSGYRLETVYTYPVLENLLDRDFVPCAVICTICGDRTELNDLTLYSDFSGAGLFLADDPQTGE